MTYQAIEPAFSSIPGECTGHFKAVPGLDVFKDVALLIVIGRPLSGSVDLAKLKSAYFGHMPKGNCQTLRRSRLMRDSLRGAVSVIAREDLKTERMHAAVCDDEMIKDIGRGRGVNRTEANPLEVQVLAEVALSMVPDSVVPGTA